MRSLYWLGVVSLVGVALPSAVIATVSATFCNACFVVSGEMRRRARGGK